MPRRIWIIAKKERVEQKDINDANANNCPEICNGIPPALDNIVFPELLPMAYEEPVPAPVVVEPPTSNHISTLVAVDASKARPARVKRMWQGQDYFYDCLATQTVKDEFVAGKIAIGDYVLVHFDDIGEQVVTSKIFKSW